MAKSVTINYGCDENPADANFVLLVRSKAGKPGDELPVAEVEFPSGSTEFAVTGFPFDSDTSAMLCAKNVTTGEVTEGEWVEFKTPPAEIVAPPVVPGGFAVKSYEIVNA